MSPGGRPRPTLENPNGTMCTAHRCGRIATGLPRRLSLILIEADMRTAIRHLLLVVTATVALLVVLGIPAVAPALARSGANHSNPGPGLDVPFVATPQAVVDKMLEIANVTGNDYL